MAQRIAARLRAASTDASSSSSATSANGSGSPASAEQSPKLNAPPARDSTSGGSDGAGRPGGGGTADLQQMISRMPAAALADLQTGDALMIVATDGGAHGPS